MHGQEGDHEECKDGCNLLEGPKSPSSTYVKSMLNITIPACRLHPLQLSAEPLTASLADAHDLLLEAMRDPADVS